ncbi:glycosyl transferase [Alteromonas lipolytica]|uniref:Glycosyl transferase n=2 Tax=Alteromonas lipolytica TaxID=1856405 RepID=A0A1E8FF34_9ALTE|nr:glycosyl transferase [Alteromonas lipolytica]
MLAIKAGVGLFPKPLREFAKKNPALTSFYSRSLQKSGLFYGFPSKRKLQALYYQTLSLQQTSIDETIKADGRIHSAVSVVIIGQGAEAIKLTLNSLQRQVDLIDRVYTEIQDLQSPWTELSSKLHGVNGSSDPVIQQDDSPLLLINAGDELHPQALACICRQKFDDILYVDSDEKTAAGMLENARLLPDWNPDYQFSAAYIESGVVFSALAKKSLTQISAKTIAGALVQIWMNNRTINISHVALSLLHYPDSKQRRRQQLKEIAEFIKTEQAAATTIADKQINVMQWPVYSQPLVSLIIPTKNAKGLVKDCIESILKKSTYQNYEILLVDNNSDEPESLAYFDELDKHPKIRVLKYPHPFNYSAINNFAVKHAKGEVIGLVNNDIEVITSDWLEYMVGHALREDIGCVGAKLMYGDDRIQHAGVVLGYGGGAGHAHKYFPRYHPGYMNRLIATQNYSAVTAACLLIKKSLFDLVGGLNETDLTVAFNDVDFCLRVRESGVRNLYCAEAELYHHESVSRGLDVSKEKMARFNAELDYLQTNWADVIAHDPAYNPNLTLRRENFSIKDQKEWNSQ